MIRATVVFLVLLILGAAFAALVPISTIFGNTDLTGLIGAIVFIVLMGAAFSKH